LELTRRFRGPLRGRESRPKKIHLLGGEDWQKGANRPSQASGTQEREKQQFAKFGENRREGHRAQGGRCKEAQHCLFRKIANGKRGGTASPA